MKGNLIPTFIVIAAIFIVINYLLTLLARYLERRLQAARRVTQGRPETEAMLEPEHWPPASVRRTAAEGSKAA